MTGIQTSEYDLAVNIKTLSDGKITGLSVGDIISQNQAVVLTVRPGEIKENPVIGVGIEDMLNDENPILWRTKIRENMELDGQSVNKIMITTSGITIDSGY